MRSIAVMLLAAAGFAYLLAAPRMEARRLVAREEAARRALLERVARGRVPGEEGGYRFRVVRGGELPPLYVAEPERPGRSGWRWFATPGDGRVFAYDLVRYHPSGGRPDLDRLRIYLARKEPGGRPPMGWRPGG